MFGKNINLACGPVFIDSPEWINLDFIGAPGVNRANLLNRLPLMSNSSISVYSSHFLEHIPKSQVGNFLQECFRVLQPGGCIRLVVPDFEEMVRAYLQLRMLGDHERADFLVIELIDQCVRREPGGELGKIYNFYGKIRKNDAMINFIRERTGEDLMKNKILPQRGLFTNNYSMIFHALASFFQHLWIRILMIGFPAAFRSQNVSFATIGERHHWLWDYHQLEQVLKAAGFISVQRRTADTSTIRDFPFYPLDLDSDGSVRKGMESMFVEAIKPQ